MEHHTTAIAGQVTHVWIEGKGHDLKGQDQRLADEVAAWVAALGLAQASTSSSASSGSTPSSSGCVGRRPRSSRQISKAATDAISHAAPRA